MQKHNWFYFNFKELEKKPSIFFFNYGILSYVLYFSFLSDDFPIYLSQ